MGFNIGGALVCAIVMTTTLRGQRGGGFLAATAALFGFFIGATPAAPALGHAIHAAVVAFGSALGSLGGGK